MLVRAVQVNAGAPSLCADARLSILAANVVSCLMCMYMLLCMCSRVGRGDGSQDTAATALWNAMVDNPEATKQFSEANGHECLLMLLDMGSDLGKELAAGAIWKVCAADDSGKTQYTAAVDGLVRLLRSEQTSAHEQAAGALRSICVSSPQNKLELNRVNAISALVATLSNRSAMPCLPVACIFP